MQSTGVYRINELDKTANPSNRKRRKLKWFIILLILIALGIGIYIFLHSLKPKTAIKNAKPVITNIESTDKLKEYNEPDFVVKIPESWQPVSRLSPAYNSYTWQVSESGTAGQQLTIYEDSIPRNYALNRVVIVHAEGLSLASDSTASDNCIQYTISGAPQYGEFGNLAKWQGVEFICDSRNDLRDVIGTSSTDGVNIVRVTGSTGTHSYLFTLDNQDNSSPDYNTLYTAIQTFQAK